MEKLQILISDIPKNENYNKHLSQKMFKIAKFSNENLAEFFNFNYLYISCDEIIVNGKKYENVNEYKKKLCYEFGSDPIKLYDFIKTFKGSPLLGRYDDLRVKLNLWSKGNVYTYEIFESKEILDLTIEKIKNIEGVDIEKVNYFAKTIFFDKIEK